MRPWRSANLSRPIVRTLPRCRGLAGVAVFVAAWQAIVSGFHLPPYLLPSPVETARTLVQDAGLLAPHLAMTLVETLAGLALAVSVGISIAILMSASRWTRDLLYPPLVLSQAIPLMAIAPLILIWFGLGILAKVLIVAFVCFFPVAVNAYEGFRAVDPAYRDLLTTLGATRADRYRHFYLPAALPGIVAGLKLSATYSVLGAIVGEWLGGSRGLGVYMTRSLQSFRTDRLFGAILVVMALSYGLFTIVDLAGARLTPWLGRRTHA
ncbi:MAG: ABC transporter permease [Candidatus Bipolaricaulis sp.]|nr:ABC transporter permease [Candidatus Bipolaricaulis sp.]